MKKKNENNNKKINKLKKIIDKTYLICNIVPIFHILYIKFIR